MNAIYKQILLLTFLSCSFQLQYAQVGVYDASFGTGGKVLQLFGVDVVPKAVALQPDGKIVVAGSGGDFFQGELEIVRYNSNGTPDAGFGINGIVEIDVPTDGDYLQSVAIQPDGKIIAAGVVNTFDVGTQQTHTDFTIFRLQVNGSYDSSFGVNGIVVTDLDALSNDVLHKIIMKPDGKIIAGGQYMDMSNGDNYYGLVQYKTDGSRDSSFGTNGITVVPLNQQDEGRGSLALLSNGQILAATTVVNDTSGFYEFGLLRFNANGILDAGFGTGGILHLGLSYFHSVLHDMAVQSDGKIVLTGQTPDGTTTSGIGVVRVDNNGAYDPTFGVNGVVRTHISANPFTPDVGMTLSIQPDKKIIVGGTLDNAINSTDADFVVVRYLANGSIDTNFGRNGIITTDFDGNGDYSVACVQQPDGKFVLVGSAGTQNFETGIGIVRYLADARFYYNTLKGSVYYDDNKNGLKDPGENYFGNAVVAAQKTGIDTMMITASTGRFEVDVDTGSYIIHSVQPADHAPYYLSIPNIRTTSHPTYFNTDSVSFAMQPIAGMRDIFVYIIPLNAARPGFATDYLIMYGNNGTDSVASGTVQYVPSPLVDITSTDPVASSTSGDTLQWSYTNLYPHDTSYIIVHGTIQAPPAVNIGDSLISFAFILPPGLDQQPKDNHFELHEDVIGSFDPNDKNESHAGQLSPQQLSTGEYLQYIIRFQNTGTDTAFNIYVRDTLQDKLDWSTMQMVTASHQYRLVMNDGICVWSFNNIRLVDSTQNEPASHGYIVYRIKPKANLITGDIINNTASIYFDYNLPVGTNTEATVITGISVPVKLLSFSARKNAKTNLLSWSTTNEVNANRFEIERSANGNVYEKTGEVSSLPGNAGIKDYEFTDASPLPALNYYRLKIVDNDGRFEYSPVRILNNKPGNYFTIYPNPVKDILRVRIESAEKTSLQAQVLTHDGKVLMSINWEVNEGVEVKTMNTLALPVGTYLLKIISKKNLAGETNGSPVVLKFEKL